MELRIEGVSKRYPGGTQALQDVSLTVPSGLFGLLGPNGAGKSSLMRTLATLQEPDAGRIRLGDLDVLASPALLRRQLGYLPQDFGVDPNARAFELLEHFALLKGIHPARERRAVCEALLERVNLQHVRRKPLGGFSGGMKQRFGIAQALLGEPRLIIVDEPTAGLDPEERVRFHNLLAQAAQSAVVLLSTHIVADVSELCPRMAILAEGRVLFEGDPLDAVAAVRGRVFSKVLADDEPLPELGCLLSTRLWRGQRVCQVLADVSPGPSFEPKLAELEDAYFAALRGLLERPSGRTAAHG